MISIINVGGTYLRCHHPLPFGDQGALGAQAFSVTTLPLVAPQPRDQTVVPAAGAFRPPLPALRLVVLVLRPAALALAAKHDNSDPSSSLLAPPRGFTMRSP